MDNLLVYLSSANKKNLKATEFGLGLKSIGLIFKTYVTVIGHIIKKELVRPMVPSKFKVLDQCDVAQKDGAIKCPNNWAPILYATYKEMHRVKAYLNRI